MKCASNDWRSFGESQFDCPTVLRDPICKAAVRRSADNCQNGLNADLRCGMQAGLLSGLSVHSQRLRQRLLSRSGHQIDCNSGRSKNGRLREGVLVSKPTIFVRLGSTPNRRFASVNRHLDLMISASTIRYKRRHKYPICFQFITIK